MPTLPSLKQVSITFNTHGEDDRDPNTVLHVFIKNRSSDTSFSDGASDYISNYLAWQSHAGLDPFDVNPYLAYGENLAAGVSFSNSTSAEYFLTLRSKPIPCEEIVLPVVNIHILPDGDDAWVFDFVVRFYFADPQVPSDPNHQYDFSFTSNTNGISGIILDQDNRNYVGLGLENQNALVAPASRPVMNSILTNVSIDFATNSGSKTAGTSLNIHIVNRKSASNSDDMVVAENLYAGQALDSSSKVVTANFDADNQLLASNSLMLQDMVLPVVNINIVPDSQQGKWAFDFRVRYFFSCGTVKFAMVYDSTTGGIVLDQYETKYAGFYQGDSFPTVNRPAAELIQGPPVDHNTQPKNIPISFLNKKLDEFINNRQGLDPQSSIAALFQLRLHNSGVFGYPVTLPNQNQGYVYTTPSNYYDLKKINANPPAPGTVLDSGYLEPVTWDSNPTDLGPINKAWGLVHVYLNDINSQSIKFSADTSQTPPLTLSIVFETGGPMEVIGVGVLDIGTMDITALSMTLRLTLTYDPKRSRIDVLSWIPELNNLVYTPLLPDSPESSVQVTGTFLGRPVNFISPSQEAGFRSLLEKVLLVDLTTSDATDLGGMLRQNIEDQLWSTLSTIDPLTGQSKADDLNAEVNSWLLGGFTDSINGTVPGDNRCVVQNASIDATGENLQIWYTGPQYLYQFVTPTPWPPPGKFEMGNLANIDHIVVLTMENRSFDQMLGYLSLPTGAGGMGRSEIDGVKVDAVNYLADGTPCKPIAFLNGETVFAPDPPHSFEPVQAAIHGGAMDGFVQSYATEHGPTVGPNIMKYHTAANVPTYDALARDFAICHRWFASHPGPTFSNRFHELTGRLNIDSSGFWELSNSSPLRPAFTDTIFDHLSDASVTWKYFEQGYCFLRFFERHTFDNKNIVDFDDPGLGFLSVAAAGDLPSVTFIDPHFIELPPGGNCDGPPADISQGQLLVQKVVNAVVTSPNWSKTMLIITYDEHGGFYDHVPPPPAVQIAPGLPQTYGVRVPTFIISPWITGGMVFGNDADNAGNPALYFDHTSILKTIATRFLSTNMTPPYMGPRYAAANDLSSIISSQLRPSQFLPFIPYTLVFAPSQLNLEVQGGNTSPGTPLLQDSTADTDAQKFAFEDAGEGNVYIRTFSGRLYLTVNPPATDTSQTFVVTQDVKYSAVTGPNPMNQKWTCVPAQVSVIGQPMYRVVCAAFPDKVLQPLGASLTAGTDVVIDAAEQFLRGPLNDQYMWMIKSPLMPGGLNFTPPNTGDGGPYLNATSSGLDFGSVDISDLSPQQAITLTATQGAQLIISSVQVVSDMGAEADFITVPARGTPPPGEIEVENGQLLLSASFFPSAAGTRTALVQIGHNLANNPLTLSLTGTGVAAAIPVLHCSAYSLSFSTTKPSPPPLVLTNTGTAPLVITSIEVVGTNFTAGSNCVGTLDPGQSCTIRITCRFQGPGDTESLVITHNGHNSPTSIDLNATSRTGGNS